MSAQNKHFNKKHTRKKDVRKMHTWKKNACKFGYMWINQVWKNYTCIDNHNHALTVNKHALAEMRGRHHTDLSRMHDV